MNMLSQVEVDQLQQSATSELYNLYRNCSLAVLNAGSHTDDAEQIYQQFTDFQIQVLRRERGVKIDLQNPPLHAFVDGKIIKGIQEHLSVVLRDILFTSSRYKDMTDISEQITHITFDILQGSASGTAVYTETHNGIINTNAFGLFTAEIGGGAGGDSRHGGKGDRDH